MPNPQISVIMGVYNIEKIPTLRASLESVCSQTMRNYEFLICDDGSHDGTLPFLRELAQDDARIRLFKNPKNQGLAFSLNHCLAHASGEFVARHDADDLSAPDRFALQLSFLQRHPDIDFVGSNVILFDGNSAYGKRTFPPFPEARDFLFTMPFVHGALMFRRAALQKAGGYRVAKETRRAEDYDLLMRMYAAHMKGANLQKPLYWFLENQEAQKRRKYRDRIGEAKVRLKGFSALHLMPGALPYVVKPLLIGLIPGNALAALKRGSGRPY